MKKLLFIIAVCVCFYLQGLSQINTENLTSLKSDFEVGPSKMSDFFSKVTYLPLETNPNCLIGYMSIRVFGKKIIIRSNGEIGDEKIFLYSDQGKFLNKIG